MSRRRVFRIDLGCPTMTAATKRKLGAGHSVAFQRSSGAGGVDVVLDGALVLGHLDPEVGLQVASALDRGQAFAPSIESVHQLPGSLTTVV
jgi:hypothetical protein